MARGADEAGYPGPACAHLADLSAPAPIRRQPGCVENRRRSQGSDGSPETTIPIIPPLNRALPTKKNRPMPVTA